MALQERDRKALLLLGIAVALFGVLQLDFVWPSSIGGGGGLLEVEAAEEQLLLARARARKAPLREAEHEAAGRLLAELEEGLLKAETPALAQAGMQRIVEEIFASESINLDSTRFAQVELEGEHYARVPLTVRFDCAIEQFVNLMAAIDNRAELLSTRRIAIRRGSPETKSVRVEMTVAGYLPSSKTPELLEQSRRGRRG